MGVRISDPRHVCLYDPVSGTAFGPVFSDALEAEDFLEWLGGRDPRDIREPRLLVMFERWQEIRAKETAA